MANQEISIKPSVVEYSTPESQLEPYDKLPIFKDTIQDFYHDKANPAEASHGHQFWRDVVEVGLDYDSAREYSVVVATPQYQQVDQPIVFTTALLTGTRGHNFNTAIHLLDLGFPLIMIGPEGEQRSKKCLAKQISNARNSSLPQTAHNTHEILDAISSNYNTASYKMFDDKNIIVIGESRGAMIGMGMPAYANEHNRKVIYSDLTAPCFPEPIRYGVKSLFDIYKQGRAEVTALKGLSKTLGLKRIAHYPSTLNFRPSYLMQALGSVPALLNGDSGLMAKHAPPNTPMHIKVFNNDYWSQPDNWKLIFKDRPEVSIKQIDGAHLTIAARETLNHIENRLINLKLELRRTGGDVSKIDFSKVHLLDRDNQSTLPEIYR